MRKSIILIKSILIMIISISLHQPQALADKKVYEMVGDIMAIDLEHNTVVIEVPLEKGMFTVGGPISARATLLKSNQSVGLSDFQIGERVVVKWEATEKGHLILLLKAK
jgi:hypothetical protein